MSRPRTSRHDSISELRLAPAVIALTLLLCVIGVVMVLSASSVTSLQAYHSPWHFFTLQLVWLALGLVAMAVGARVDYHRWRRWAAPLLAVSVLGLVAVLGVGTSVNGATRWIHLGPLDLQPSEPAKLAVVLVAARVLADRIDRLERARSYRPVLLVAAVVVGLVMLQPDMGTSMIIVAVTLIELAMAGVRGKHLAAVFLPTVVLGFAAVMASTYRRARFFAFLNPWADPYGNGYQNIQGLAAMASGHLFGTGLGAGSAQWGSLPNAYTDFIYAIVVEQTGLLGGLALVALFVAFAYLGVRVAVHARDVFGALLAAGITGWVVVQALLNIGAVVSVLPITGVPLPFISYGGTSMILLLFAVGVLVNIAVAGQPPRSANPDPAQRPVTHLGL